MPTNQAEIDASDNADDFDAEFARIASGKDHGPGQADDLEADDPVDGADDQSSPPAEAAGTEAKAAGDTPPAQAEPSDDIWSNAPPEYREAHEKAVRDLSFKYESTKGRLSALDRKLADIQQKQSQQEGQVNPSKTEGAAEASEDGKPSNDRLDALKRLKEDYPEIGEPVVAIIEDLQEELAQVRQPIATLNEQQQLAAKQAQYQILAEAHPDYQALSRDERWGGWIETQPRAVQEAFARNIDVTDGREAAWVLGLFKQDMGITNASAPAVAQQQPANEIAEKRRRQLEAGRDAGNSGSASVTAEMPDDFDAEFQRLARAKEAKRLQSNR
mgnify:CR=1 FL=1